MDDKKEENLESSEPVQDSELQKEGECNENIDTSDRDKQQDLPENPQECNILYNTQKLDLESEVKQESASQKETILQQEVEDEGDAKQVEPKSEQDDRSQEESKPQDKLKPSQETKPQQDTRSEQDTKPQQDIKVKDQQETKPQQRGKSNQDNVSEKANIYKSLAIKLKKELVKLKEDSAGLNEKVESLEKTNVSLETKARLLQRQLDTAENDLQALQNEFQFYKVKASEIMQQHSDNKSNYTCNAFEDNLYKQLKESHLVQHKRIESLESKLKISLDKFKDQEEEIKSLTIKAKDSEEQIMTIKNLNNKLETLTRENENLKIALKQFRSKLKEPTNNNCDEVSAHRENVQSNIDSAKTKQIHLDQSQDDKPEIHQEEVIVSNDRVSPSASMKDNDSNTNSSSSFDGSTSGYVHIKPTTFEIISKSSALEETQAQLDHITKAYLDSESTNSLLTEQVSALKEEIRRLQRGTERMDLAENLEYLKNILFKFLTLDSGQSEQKERLIPVLSTVLKLSPEETTKLHTLTVIDKPSMASSFFKL